MLILARSCIFIVVTSLFAGLVSCTFTITNNCPYTIWPGTLAGAGTPPLSTTGFQLDPGHSVSVASTPGWSGNIWARTGCEFDAFGIGRCETGDCAGRLQCDGSGATPPISLFEITLGQGEGKDFYDVSMVDGYNMPLMAVPRGGYGECNVTGCAWDLNLGINTGCPKELQVVGGDKGGLVGCKSACKALALDQYCCSGQFANPTTCQPSYYSTIFKTACPRAYSYAFDDRTSTFTCKAQEYAIIFCPRADGMNNDNAPPIQEYNRSSQALVSAACSILPLPITMILIIILLLLSTCKVFIDDRVVG
ncbi:hypothetical protein QQ045_013191 [Rhodiola kirilowii]